MAQEQPKRAETEEQQQQPIKYGDVFLVSEKIANKPIAPLDAATMQPAENQLLGHTQKGGPAAVMQADATKNEQAGVTPHGTASDVGSEQGMTATESNLQGQRDITQSIDDQVVFRHVDPNPKPNPNPEKMVAPPAAVDPDAVTIGEALEASAISAGDRPITQTDAAAIQDAEMRVTGSGNTPPGGLGAEAQSARMRNERIMSYEEKTTLSDVLTNAATRLPHDKPATIEDTERVIVAEVRNDPKLATNLGGVRESVATAARMNRERLKVVAPVKMKRQN